MYIMQACVLCLGWLQSCYKGYDEQRSCKFVTEMGVQSNYSWSCMPVSPLQLLESAERALLLTRCRDVSSNFDSSILWRRYCNRGWYHLGWWQQFPRVYPCLSLAAGLYPSTCLGSWQLLHSWGLEALAHCLNQPGMCFANLYKEEMPNFHRCMSDQLFD